MALNLVKLKTILEIQGGCIPREKGRLHWLFFYLFRFWKLKFWVHEQKLTNYKICNCSLWLYIRHYNLYKHLQLVVRYRSIDYRCVLIWKGLEGTLELRIYYVIDLVAISNCLYEDFYFYFWSDEFFIYMINCGTVLIFWISFFWRSLYTWYVNDSILSLKDFFIIIVYYSFGLREFVVLFCMLSNS